MTDFLRIAAAAALLAFLAPAASPAADAPGGDRVLRGLAKRSWIVAGPPRAFPPSELYREIDGEAELFLPFDFRELIVAYLARKSNPDVQIRVELYRHGSPRDAFGIYSQHRFPGQETVPVGPSAAIVSDASLDFFRGERFVRIRTTGSGGGRKDLLELGAAISGLLDGTGDPPPETEALNVPGLVPESVMYQKKAVFGYELLAPGYEAKFSDGPLSGRLLLLPRHPGVGSAASVAGLAGGLPGFAKAGEGLFRADLHGGTLWLREAGNYVVGVEGGFGREQAEPLLRKMAGAIMGIGRR